MAIMIAVFGIITAIALYDWLMTENQNVKATQGVLDASEWSFSDDGVIQLRGEWEYYSGELLDSDDFHANAASDKQFVHVPASLKDIVSAGYIRGNGAATYRLLIHVQEPGLYSLRAKKIRLSSRIFVNGMELGGSGRPALSEREYVPSNAPFYHSVMLEKGLSEIIVQTASFNNLGGGLIQAPEFGRAADVGARLDAARLSDMALIAMLFVFGLYYAAMFRQWGKERYLMYFSLFCLSAGLFFSIDNEILALSVLPYMTFPVLQKLLFLLPVLAFYSFFCYVISYFGETDTAAFKWLRRSAYAYALLLVVIPNVYLANTLWVGVPLQICVFAILLRSIFRGRSKGIDGGHNVLLGVFFLIVCWIFGELRYLFALDNPYYMVGTPLLLLLSQAMQMSERLQDNFLRSEQLAEKLLQYDRQKDEFLAKTSHELRTPLHGIVNLSQSLLDNKERPLQSEHRDNIRLLHLMGRRLSGLVHDILDLNRIRHGQLLIHPTSVNVGTSLRFVMETLSVSPVSKEVRLVNELPASLPLVIADENRLKQILHNLLENGLKFTKQGTVRISAQCKGDELAISVSDTGIGIPADQISNMLQPFVQYGGDEDKGAATGLGLGLSISKQLIELQGGRLEVESAVGQGSRFTFTLPLDKHSEASSTDSGLEPSVSVEPIIEYVQTAPGAAFHILIVDDETSNIKILTDEVSALRYSYTAVRSGEEALEALLGGLKPDLVLLDLMLTGISGLEVCHKIRTMKGLAELPILMLTASGQTGDIVASFDAGANDILQKPFELVELKARVKSLLAMKSSSERAVRREMDFLQAQITPHFLYNSLNSLVGLSYTDAGMLRETIYNLTTYLRAKFTFVFDSEMIPLEKELELVKAYAAIEQLRFGERLRILYDLEEDIRCFIPPLTLQPIVENAVRHGIGPRPEGGTVHIAVKRRAGNIEIVVQDDGVGISLERMKLLDDDQASGIGIENVNRRLTMLYNRRLEINSLEGQGTRIKLIIPEEANVESHAD